MKKGSIFFLLFILFFSNFLIFRQPSQHSPKKREFRCSDVPLQQEAFHEGIRHVKDTFGSYFLPVPITKFTRANQPCISIYINGKPESALLDLGFRGQFAFSSDLLSNMKDKKYMGTQKMYGVHGNEYEENLYELPVIEIDRMTFSQPIIHEESWRFHQDATVLTEDGILSAPEPNKVGWELFGNTNLFLDLRNSKIAFCDGIETLESHGYLASEFIKTDLFLERGLIEIEVELTDKPLRCMLDTGATWNVYNQFIGEANQDQQYICQVFRINNKDFGPIKFHQLPIGIPILIEAILGMEFFQDHLVFLDFSKKYVYIKQN